MHKPREEEGEAQTIRYKGNVSVGTNIIMKFNGGTEC